MASYEIRTSVLNYDGSTVKRSNSTESFSEAIGIYTSAIEYMKGEVLWGPDAIEARIRFYVNSRMTELSHIRYVDGHYEMVQTQH